ncbi:hypothetical protein A9Q78_08685 [Methylophaga sp. 41_12_T18]|nr:hypothetical protein A9Q78_08685 [Methylophaga sp. 41_12_T18]
MDLLRTIKPIEWMLFILFLVAPLYFHPNIGGTGLRIPNNIVIWFVASIIGFYSLYKLTVNQHIYLPRHFILLLSFPILALFSGIIAGIENIDLWLFRMLYIWGGVLFLFGLFQHQLKQIHFDRLLFVLLFSGFIHSLVGLSQIVIVTNYPNWLPFNANAAPTGLFQQINNQASFQVTIVLVGLWLTTRPFIRHGHIWRFIALITIISLSSFIVSYSGSRVGALAFILALPLMLISRWHFVKTDKKRWLSILIMFVIAISSANLIEQKRGLGSVLEKTAAINAGYSSTARLGIYNISLDLIKEKPLFGHGIGSFARVWQYEKPDFYQQHPEATLPSQRVSHPHNEALFWLVEGGLVAAVGILLLSIGIILSLLKLPVSRRYAYAALLIPISLHTQVELPFYISAQHWFVFLLLLALILRPSLKPFTIKLSKIANLSIKLFAIAAGFASIIFISHSYAASNEFKAYVLKQAPAERPFQIAQQNPYFDSLATDVMMLSMFQTSMKYGITSSIKIFAEWSEQAIISNPHIVYFRMAVDANLFLQQTEQACLLAVTGNAIYPNDNRLESAVQHCERIS